MYLVSNAFRRMSLFSHPIIVTIILIIIYPTFSFGLERFDIITTEELRQMMEKKMAGELDFILVNSLDEIIFRDSSIPGSINVPWSKVNQMSDRLGGDKDRLIVTY